MIVSELPGQDHLRPSRRKIVARCDNCPNERVITRAYYDMCIRRGHNRCQSCATKSVHTRRAAGEIVISTDSRAKVKRAVSSYRLIWANSQRVSRATHTLRVIMDCGATIRVRHIPKYICKRPVRRRPASDLRIQLYNRLRSVGAYFDTATIIGHYRFDCMVYAPDRTKILINVCDNLHPVIDRGATKRRFLYIEHFFPGFEILHISREEVLNGDLPDRLLDNINTSRRVDFNFGDVTVRRLSYDEVAPAFSAHHYVKDGQGIAIGAILGNVLIAAVIYSKKNRSNDNFQQDYREIHKLYINTCYNRKHFANWFMMRSYAFLDVPAVISYAATTRDNGVMSYVKMGFDHVFTDSLNHWYINTRGVVMHKSTVCEMSKRQRLTEPEFTRKYAFRKHHGHKRVCFARRVV